MYLRIDLRSFLMVFTETEIYLYSFKRVYTSVNETIR